MCQIQKTPFDVRKPTIASIQFPALDPAVIPAIFIASASVRNSHPAGKPPPKLTRLQAVLPRDGLRLPWELFFPFVKTF